MAHPDMLMMAWVSSHSAANYVLKKNVLTKLKQVTSMAFGFCLLGAGLAGFGRHDWDLNPVFMRYALALDLLYPPAMWLAKASFIFQQINFLEPKKSGLVYRTCHVLIWGNLAFYLCIFFAFLFQCYPIWKVWDQSAQGHCIKWKLLLVVSSAFNMLSDLLTLLLPIWTTWHLEMTPGRKPGVIAIFALGLL